MFITSEMPCPPTHPPTRICQTCMEPFCTASFPIPALNCQICCCVATLLPTTIAQVGPPFQHPPSYHHHPPPPSPPPPTTALPSFTGDRMWVSDQYFFFGSLPIAGDGNNSLLSEQSDQHPLTPYDPNEPENRNSGTVPSNPNFSSRMNNDPPPDDYRTLYRRPRNRFGRFDCFKDCVKTRFADKGFKRRGNLWAHLRICHKQGIPRGG